MGGGVKLMDSKKKIKQANKKIRKFGVDVAVF